MRVLAGDIGGTKTLLVVADVAGTTVTIVREQRFASVGYDSLSPMVREFLDAAGKDAAGITRACFGVAGPITSTPEGGHVEVTNLPWVIDAGALARNLKLQRVSLINDFQAVGYGIDSLAVDELVSLQVGQAMAGAPRAVIGAGTGLGQGIGVWQGDCYEALPTEGGHVDFAPTNAQQIRLLECLMQRHKHVSYERVVCGPGLATLYEFLRDIGVATEPPEMMQALASTDDAAAVIGEAGLAGSDELAVAALDLFCDIYGAQAGNLALTTLARGGVYLAGGIAIKILPKLKSGRFIAAFNNKGRMQKILEQIPVQVITNPRVGLLGAAQVAARG